MSTAGGLLQWVLWRGEKLEGFGDFKIGQEFAL